MNGAFSCCRFDEILLTKDLIQERFPLGGKPVPVSMQLNINTAFRDLCYFRHGHEVQSPGTEHLAQVDIQMRGYFSKIIIFIFGACP